MSYSFEFILYYYVFISSFKRYTIFTIKNFFHVSFWNFTFFHCGKNSLWDNSFCPVSFKHILCSHVLNFIHLKGWWWWPCTAKMSCCMLLTFLPIRSEGKEIILYGTQKWKFMTEKNFFCRYCMWNGWWWMFIPHHHHPYTLTIYVYIACGAYLHN